MAWYLKWPADSGSTTGNNKLCQISGIATTGTLVVSLTYAENFPAQARSNYLYDGRRSLDSTVDDGIGVYIYNNGQGNTSDWKVNGNLTGSSGSLANTARVAGDVISFTAAAAPDGVVAIGARFNETESWHGVAVRSISITDTNGTHTINLSASGGSLNQFTSTDGMLTVKLVNFSGTSHWVYYNSITSAGIPNNTLGAALNQACAINLDHYFTGATNYSILSGSLPTGLSIVGNQIVGTPAGSQTTQLVIRASNALDTLDSATITFNTGLWKLQLPTSSYIAIPTWTVAANQDFVIEAVFETPAVLTASGILGNSDAASFLVMNAAGTYMTRLAWENMHGDLSGSQNLNAFEPSKKYIWTTRRISNLVEGTITDITNPASPVVRKSYSNRAFSSAFSFTRIGDYTANGFTGSFHSIELSRSGDNRYYDPNTNGGVGNLLIDRVSNQNGTQAGTWPSDNSEWVSNTFAMSTLNQGSTAYILMPEFNRFLLRQRGGRTSIKLQISHHVASGTVNLIGDDTSIYGLTYNIESKEFIIDTTSTQSSNLPVKVDWPMGAPATIEIVARIPHNSTSEEFIDVYFNGTPVLLNVFVNYGVLWYSIGKVNYLVSPITLYYLDIKGTLANYTGTWKTLSNTSLLSSEWPESSNPSLLLEILSYTGSTGSWWTSFNSNNTVVVKGHTIRPTITSYQATGTQAIDLPAPLVFNTGLDYWRIRFRCRIYETRDGLFGIVGANTGTNANGFAFNFSGASANINLNSGGSAVSGVASTLGLVLRDSSRFYTYEIEHKPGGQINWVRDGEVVEVGSYASSHNVATPPNSLFRRVENPSTGVCDMELEYFEYQIGTTKETAQTYVFSGEGLLNPGNVLPQTFGPAIGNATQAGNWPGDNSEWKYYERVVSKPATYLGVNPTFLQTSVGQKASIDLTTLFTGTETPFTYSVYSGTLPTGMSLDTTTGNVTGTPTSAGNFTFRIMATDTDGDVAVSDTIPVEVLSKKNSIYRDFPSLTAGTSLVYGDNNSAAIAQEFWEPVEQIVNDNKTGTKPNATIQALLALTQRSKEALSQKPNALANAILAFSSVGKEVSSTKSATAVNVDASISTSYKEMQFAKPNNTINADANVTVSYKEMLFTKPNTSVNYDVSSISAAKETSVSKTAVSANTDVSVTSTKETSVSKSATTANFDIAVAAGKETSVSKSATSANFDIATTAAKEARPSKPNTQINTDIAGIAATKEALSAITLLANISTNYLYQIIYDIGGSFSSLITVSTSKASTKSVNSVKTGTSGNVDVSGIGATKTANSTKQNVSASSDFVIGSGNKTPSASKPGTQVNVDALAAAVKDVGTVKVNSSILADIMSLASKEVGYQKPATSASVDFASFLYEISYGITGSFTSVVLASLVLQATKEALSQKPASSGGFSGIKVATKESSSQKPASSASISTSKVSTKAINSGMYSEVSTSTQYNWTREAFSGIFTEISLSWEIFGTAKDIAKQIVLIDSDYQRVFEFFTNEVVKFNIDGDSTAYSLEYTTDDKVNYLSYVGEDSQQTVTYTTKESKCLQ